MHTHRGSCSLSDVCTLKMYGTRELWLWKMCEPSVLPAGLSAIYAKLCHGLMSHNSQSACLADRRYISPDGQLFKSYAKAQEQWHKAQHGFRRRRRSQGTADMQSAEQEEDGPEPQSFRQLIEWQRGIAATLGVTTSHQSFFRALQRAQQTSLLVRSSRARA